MTEKPYVWMPLFVADWDADTAHLTCAEDGAYGRLVRYYWRMGPPPDDNARLASITRSAPAEWRKLRPVLAGFFQIEGGVWRHKRVDEELTNWTEKKARFAARSAAGGRAKAAKSSASSSASSTPEAVLAGCTSPSPLKEEGPHSPSSPQRGGGRRSRDERAAPPPESHSGKPFAEPELRAAVVAEKGEDFARSWLDPCGWRNGPDRQVLAPRSFTADRLNRECEPVFRRLNVRAVVQSTAQEPKP